MDGGVLLESQLLSRSSACIAGPLGTEAPMTRSIARLFTKTSFITLSAKPLRTRKPCPKNVLRSRIPPGLTFISSDSG